MRWNSAYKNLNEKKSQKLLDEAAEELICHAKENFKNPEKKRNMEFCALQKYS